MDDRESLERARNTISHNLKDETSKLIMFVSKLYILSALFLE